METFPLDRLLGRGEPSSWLGWQENIGTMKRSDCPEAVGQSMEEKDAQVLTATHTEVRAPNPLAASFTAESSLGGQGRAVGTVIKL